jgi:hypothetical protein
MKKRYLFIFVLLAVSETASSQIYGLDGQRALDPIVAAESGGMSVAAIQIARNYASVLNRAQSAPQATQVSNETSVYLQVALIKQNDEIIRLLKKIAKE